MMSDEEKKSNNSDPFDANPSSEIFNPGSEVFNPGSEALTPAPAKATPGTSSGNSEEEIAVEAIDVHEMRRSQQKIQQEPLQECAPSIPTATSDALVSIDNDKNINENANEDIETNIEDEDETRALLSASSDSKECKFEKLQKDHELLMKRFLSQEKFFRGSIMNLEKKLDDQNNLIQNQKDELDNLKDEKHVDLHYSNRNLNYDECDKKREQAKGDKSRDNGMGKYKTRLKEESERSHSRDVESSEFYTYQARSSYLDKSNKSGEDFSSNRTKHRGSWGRQSTMLFQKFAKKMEEEEDNKQTLTPDSYSYLVVSKLKSRSFILGISVFVIQVTTSVLLTFNLLSPFNWPKNVDTAVRTTQAIALTISVLIQDDVQNSIQQVGNRFTYKSVDEIFEEATACKWYFASLCRLFSGFLVLLATFVLICEADNVKDLLLNFTAVSFISQIDDMVFNLGSIGFFGPRTGDKSKDILDKKYDVESEWNSVSAYLNQLLLFLVFSIMIIAWAIMANAQITGMWLCKTVYVHIGDNSATHLSSSSGIYDRVFSKVNDDRSSYVERRTDPLFNFTKQGRLGYCAEADSSYWSLAYLPEEEHCNNLLAISAQYETYDVTETTHAPWMILSDAEGGNLEMPLGDFEITCLAWGLSDGEYGNKEKPQECPQDYYGMRCDKENPCARLSLETPTAETTSNYFILKPPTDEDFINPLNSSINAYNRPIYTSYNEKRTELILFTGARWIMTSTDYFDELKDNYDHRSIAEYFAHPNVFHASTLKWDAVEYMSDAQYHSDEPTPLGLKWYHTDHDKIGLTPGLPQIQTSRPAEGLALSCSFCDNVTNPCYFDGLCQEDGSCLCKHGATSTFCDIPPTGNSKCNLYFNRAEFNYDGGDCCGATCASPKICGVSALKGAFGVESLGSSGSGFPNCIDPKMVPITIQLQSNGAHYLRMQLICNDINYLDVPAYSVPVDLDAVETVYVKDGTDCEFRLDLEENYFEIFVAPPRVEVTIYGQNQDNDQILLVESKGIFSNIEELPFIERMNFVVVKPCLESIIHDYDKLLYYKQTPKGQELRWNDHLPEGRAIKWLNADDSRFSSCKERDPEGLNQRYLIAIVNFATNNTLSEYTWLSDVHECDWTPGLICRGDQSNKQIETIDLRNLQLSGTIPRQIGQLTTLHQLNMGDNNLYGPIPTSIGMLTNIKRFLLDLNHLTGIIPSEIGNLNQTNELNLEWNKLEGNLPSEFGNIEALEVLTLSSNRFNGTMPSEFGNLRKLIYLRMGVNKFSGNIPSELGLLRRLQRIEIYDNEFFGGIPSELNFLRKLKYFDAQKNKLNSTLPELLGSLSNLEWLQLNDNNITGSIPSQLGRLSKLGTFNIAQNNFIGTIPTEMGQLGRINLLFLWDNDLTGSIPSEFGQLDNLMRLYLNKNQFTGTIPKELGKLEALKQMFLYENQLNGTIHTELGGCLDLENLLLKSNQLSGTIPTEIGRMTLLEEIGLQHNTLSGSLPTELGECRKLMSLDLNENRINGTIPSELGYLSYLAALVLHTNNFSGAIPSELGRLTRLTTLTFANNQLLSGILPSEIGNLVEMDLLDIYLNQVAGSIPSEIGRLSKLRSFSVAKNQMTGTLPSQMGNLVKLTSLLMKENDFIGTIPSEFGRFTDLVDLSIGANSLGGSIPSEIGKLTNLVRVSMSFNQLTGRIPSEIGNLELMTLLHLYYNQLTGPIPPELGDLRSLVDLKLMHNRLSGSIPSELGGMYSIRKMDLYGNLLTGSIATEFGNLHNLMDLQVHGNSLTSVPSEVCELDLLDQLIVDCNDVRCPSNCQCRSKDRAQWHYSCPTTTGALTCRGTYAELHISIVPDAAPQETSWDLMSLTGVPILSGGPNDARVCIPYVDSCMVFTIYDAYGDGMCCHKGMGSGSYTLFLNNTLFYYGGRFAAQESVAIGLGCPQQ